MGKFDDLKTWHADAEGRNRTIRAFEKIEAAFPDWSACKIAEGYRGWLDDNEIEAESETGWLHEDGARDYIVDQFISERAQQKQEGGE